MLTVGALAKKHNLSRSTLLYYNRIGLLVPSERSEAGYRLYSAHDDKRLERICIYRRTGMSLEDIESLLKKDYMSQSSEHVKALEERLAKLNDEYENIRNQQATILAMVNKKEMANISRLFTADRFNEMLLSMGMNEEERNLFHVKMEMASSTEHYSFLKFLGLDEEKIQNVITLCREYIQKNS